jgi:hypothetical protein
VRRDVPVRAHLRRGLDIPDPAGKSLEEVRQVLQRPQPARRIARRFASRAFSVTFCASAISTDHPCRSSVSWTRRAPVIDSYRTCLRPSFLVRSRQSEDVCRFASSSELTAKGPEGVASGRLQAYGLGSRRSQMVSDRQDSPPRDRRAMTHTAWTERLRKVLHRPAPRPSRYLCVPGADGDSADSAL